MNSYDINVTLQREVAITDKVALLMRMFGLTTERLDEKKINITCHLKISPGDIVYITGPSGSGKTVLLNELKKNVPTSERITLAEIKLPADRTVIDCMAGELLENLKTLSIAGLNDVFSILNQPAKLSDGQKYRFRLAKVLAADKKYIFADEFCSGLDMITASVLCCKLRKYASARAVTFVLAGADSGPLADLQPDVIVTNQLYGPAEVIYKNTEISD